MAPRRHPECEIVVAAMADELRIEKCGVRLSNHNRRAAGFGWTTFALAVLPAFGLWLSGLVGMGTAGLDLMFPSWVAACLTALPALYALAGRADFAQLVVSDGRIVAHRNEDSVAFALENIRTGTVVPGLGLLLLMFDGRTATIHTDDDTAEQILAVSGLASAQQRFQTQFRPGLKRPAALIACVVLVYSIAITLAVLGMRLETALVGLLATSALIAVSILGTRQTQLEVGADGVLVHRKIGKQFIPHRDITAVELTPNARALRLEVNGAWTEVKIPGNFDKEALALHRRVQRARATHADSPLAPARLELLARGSRSMQAWRDDLATLLHREAGFRRPPMSRDDLEAILEAPGTSAEHRVAAAMALQTGRDDGAPRRIRIAAEACAEDRARAALLRIADEDYEHAAVAEALAGSDDVETAYG